MTMKISILSQRAATASAIVKHAGKVRPGIKVLTATARQNPQAQKIYTDGVAKRMKFSEIEKLIVTATNIKNPMYPRNTPYFNVAASDFGMPEIADIIVNKYGEMRDGDTEKRLYRFPVVFHADRVEEIYPNQFRRYGGEPGFESHYGDDGVRYCRYLPEVTADMIADQKARRIKRQPRRTPVIRGKCEPAICPEFLQGQCKFRGTLHFYIPGIPTTGLMIMETTSEYAAEAIWSDLDRIYHALGTIPRTNPLNPGKSIFYITKVQEMRSYFDESGQKKSGLQWVPKLQADIDLGALLALARPLLPANTPVPVAWLSAPKGMPAAAVLDPLSEGDPDNGVNRQERRHGVPEIDEKVAALGLNDDKATAYLALKFGVDWQARPDLVAQASKQLNDFARVGNECAALLVDMVLAVAEIGLDMPHYQQYLVARHGKRFTSNANLLREVAEELARFKAIGREQAIAAIDVQMGEMAQMTT